MTQCFWYNVSYANMKNKNSEIPQSSHFKSLMKEQIFILITKKLGKQETITLNQTPDSVFGEFL